jgi:hypothetical protein
MDGRCGVVEQNVRLRERAGAIWGPSLALFSWILAAEDP